MRSCQLVYVLLLLCSVHGLDARALGLLAPDSIGAVTSAQQGGSAEGRACSARVEAQAVRQSVDQSSHQLFRTPQAWSGPSGHARAVAAFTSFNRA